jgi:glycosyltransferase involved in cell wall biosynthesis
MKILHVCSNYYPAKGGPQYTLKHLSENFAAYYNDEVEVATSDSFYGPEMNIYKKIRPSFEVINNVKIHRFPFRRWHYGLLDFANKASRKLKGKALTYSLLKYRRALDCSGIEKMMKLADADVIMASTAHYMFCDYPLWRSKTKDPKPFVLYGSIHLHFQHEINSPYIKRAKICDAYIANTDFEKQAMINYGIDENKIITAGTGINVSDFICDKKIVTEWRHQHDIEDDEVLIAHIGRLSKGKGTELVLRVFSKIYAENKKIKLLLAGTSTEYVPELKQIIAAQKLPVILLENFDESLKPILLNAMDIFVSASRGESFGVVFLEAWACRKPVMAAGLGALASIIDDNKNGFLFEPESADSLFEKMNLLIKDNALRNEFGNNGYKKAAEEFNWKNITAKYRLAYLKAIENFKTTFSK